MPSFGKRTPFSDIYLAPFEQVYGDDPNGQSPRKEGEYSFNAESIELAEANENQGIDERLAHSRWRKFSRDWIRENKDDSLDISWLRDDDSTNMANLAKPEILIQEAKDKLEKALNELDDLLMIQEGTLDE